MISSAPARAAAPGARHVAAIALAALISAGCANAPAETATGAGTDVGDQAGPTEPTPSPAELQALVEERRESSRCMRENGVEDFPDPDANGHILYYGDDPDMAAASETCDAGPPGERERTPGHGG
jgi:predicted small secreted protein